MKPVIRDCCVICGSLNFEHLYTLKLFPVFAGCVENSSDQDLKMNMSFLICKSCGTIQLSELVPLDILYQKNHNEAIGSLWKQHHLQLADFILAYEHGENRLEIGGASGLLASFFRQQKTSGQWLILEPNPIPSEQQVIPNTDFCQGFFDDNFAPPFEIDTFIHSHVMEHWYEPSQVLQHINQILLLGKKMIFSIPNMEYMLTKKYTNCLFFEHTYYLTEEATFFLLEKYGFRVLEKKYFVNHSIFYACEKVRDIEKISSKSNKKNNDNLPDKYINNKLKFQSFIDYIQTDVDEIKKILSRNNLQHNYIFGAHIFTQYLFAMGLPEHYFLNILDNGTGKINKRLYGTNLIVKSPQVLKDHGEALVVLRAGNYNDEIKYDVIDNINSNVLFC